MRLTTMIIIAALMQVSAATFGQKVTLKGNGMSLEQVFREIRKQTGYDVLVYTKNAITAKKIDVNFKDTPLNQVMDKVVLGTELGYTIEDKNVVIKEKEPSFLDRFLGSDDGAFADIRGVVRNERGESLEGITVMVKGAKTGARTNAKGEFVLKGVKKGDVLVFTGVAIEPFEYTVKDDKNIDLNLKARLVQLEEVGINTGYQKISKERFVGSYAQLDSANYHRRAGMGILERLNGTVSGVLFANITGADIQIRGISTIGNSTSFTPLVIVDGFPFEQNINSINANDVENITVLKDAAAASIWGARAGNGVIVITTKKGRYNQPLQANFSSNVNFTEKPDLYYNPQINSSDFIDVEQFLFSKGFYTAKLNDAKHPAVTPVVEILDKIQKGTLSPGQGAEQIKKLRNLDVRNHLDRYVYQPAIAQQHYFSLSSGTNKMNYLLSAGYNRSRSNIQGTKPDDQNTIISSASYRPLKNLEIQVGINLSQSKYRSTSFALPFKYPYAQLVGENGEYLALPYDVTDERSAYIDTVGSGGLLDWHYYPLQEHRLSDRIAIERSAQLNLAVSYQIRPWLGASFSSMYNIQPRSEKIYSNQQTYFTRNMINTFTNFDQSDPKMRYPVPLGGILNISNFESIASGFRGTLNVNKTFENKHSLSGMVAGEISERDTKGNLIGIYGYNAENGSYSANIDYANRYPTYGNFDLPHITNGNKILGERTDRTVSLLGNILYSYMNKYSFYGSARKDGANVFGTNTNNKWKPLWSVGLSWDILREEFYPIKWLTGLKLKMTHGYSGNRSSLSALATLDYLDYLTPNSNFVHANVKNPPNPNLRWETVGITNVALDFSLLAGKVSGSVDWFRKKSTDLISAIPFAPSSGVISYTINSANLKGQGYEITLNSINSVGQFKWNTNFGLSHSKMIVTKVILPNLYRAGDFVNANINPSLGRIAFGLSSYRWSGLDPDTGDPRGYLNGIISKDYDLIARDSVDHQIFHGSSIPLYSGFLMNSFSWKNITFSFNITYRLSYYFRKATFDYSTIESGAIHSDYLARWQKPGDEQKTNIPSLIYPVPVAYNLRYSFYRNAEINVLRGDHIRLQDIRLQYSLNSNSLKKNFLKDIQLFLYANNLNVILWRKNKQGLDPDFQNGVGPVRSISGGINFNF